MSTIKNYLSLIKFSHTIFAMPFALIGFVLGAREPLIGWIIELTRDYIPSSWSGIEQPKPMWQTLILVVLCMVFARSAAMAFNRYLDREFDAKNPRTAIREIPAGILKADRVLMFTIVNCLLFVIICWFINRICFYLSPVALFVVLFYSYTKRFTPLCHLVLGVGLSLAPIGAFLAVTGHFELLPILFSFAVVFWVSGFDIIYALQDEEFDRSNKLHSIPAWLGKVRALRVSEGLHVLSAACVITAGFVGHFHWLYWTGIAVFVGMLIYQHAIVKPNDLRRVNLAFMTANGIASVVFAVFVIADLLLIWPPNPGI
ncbi:UbiA-like polyprenyltransferase [Paraflavitalea sp. CAU 1676]|uniref:UbiA-like polyprenyltransferase n=1 Tax=Paraflavitalea sp. CAU 1676 TaxID=3032598 RepID=UPI0023DB4E78|nr:UbiA-like polyprenyltransferase [Paraflavitalea sp. CAU 1676]MDF2191760.1 putative 4-hydroxybenzoate polyprenyltransferase [Paraflavitalea sp. CAU 1676]